MKFCSFAAVSDAPGDLAFPDEAGYVISTTDVKYFVMKVCCMLRVMSTWVRHSIKLPLILIGELFSVHMVITSHISPCRHARARLHTG